MLVAARGPDPPDSEDHARPRPGYLRSGQEGIRRPPSARCRGRASRTPARRSFLQYSSIVSEWWSSGVARGDLLLCLTACSVCRQGRLRVVHPRAGLPRLGLSGVSTRPCRPQAVPRASPLRLRGPRCGSSRACAPPAAAPSVAPRRGRTSRHPKPLAHPPGRLHFRSLDGR